MTEWYLAFRIEANDAEADLRYRHLTKALQEDANVAEVHVSESLNEETRYLIVKFCEGCTTTANVTLQHLDKIYRMPPPVTKARHLYLLEPDDDL